MFRERSLRPIPVPLRLPVASPRLTVDAVPVLNGDHDPYRECRMWLPTEPARRDANGNPARTPPHARLAPVSSWALAR